MGSGCCGINTPIAVRTPISMKQLHSSRNKYSNELGYSNSDTKLCTPSSKPKIIDEEIIHELKIACEKGDSLKLKELYEKGINLEIKLNKRLSIRPIHILTNKGHINAIEYLISKQININVLDFNKWSPLFIAANNGYVNITKLLLSNVS